MASEEKKKSRTGGIRTLSDLNRRSADSDSDSDGPPEYYTGGEKRKRILFWEEDAYRCSRASQVARAVLATTDTTVKEPLIQGLSNLVAPMPCRINISISRKILWRAYSHTIKRRRLSSIGSGMLVQDPTKDNDVDSIFDQARELGATEGPFDPSSASSSSSSFAGTGRLLSGETVQPTPAQPETVVHNIIFWSNGFTINDGPLRRLDDPENASFLESIKKSECPKELEPADRGTSVHVNLIRRNEKCPEPVKQHVPFQGVGRTLGSSSTPAASEPMTASTPLNTAPTPSAGLVVDEKLPSTSVQLRLANGTRIVGHFNYHHTISDIRAFIDASRPEGPRNYHLQIMGFPPKLLNDPSQTIEQAGLANSVVIQKL